VTFFVAVNQAFGNVVGVINTFPLEKVRGGGGGGGGSE